MHLIGKILMIFLLIVLTFSSTIVPQEKLSNSPQLTIVHSYIKAFNSGDESLMQKFFESSLSQAALEQRSIEQRIERYRLMQNELLALELRQIVRLSNEEITASMQNTAGEQLTFTFEFEPTPPHKLTSIRIERGEPAQVETGPPISRAEFLQAMEEYLADRVKADKFSGVALVALGDTPLVKKAYGYAEKQSNIPNQTDTKFNLGSINKIFTKIAIGQLAEKGELTFNDRVIQHLLDYPNKQVAEKVTIQQLLEMTSGMGDFFGERFEKTPKDKIRSLQDYLQFFISDSLLFEPGTQRRYSNAGYIVLGLIIEALSKQDYYTYVRQHIYQPAGMENSDWYETDSIVPNIATGYIPDDRNKGMWLSNLYTKPARGSSAGGGYSTADDLVKFINALKNGKLLSPEYSLWVFTGDYPSQVSHKTIAFPIRRGGIGIAGGAPGINAALEFDAENDQVVIVLSNYGPPSAENVAQKIRGLLKRMR